jgi:uncharacterized protein YqjF (DUF2071 family)
MMWSRALDQRPSSSFSFTLSTIRRLRCIDPIRTVAPELPSRRILSQRWTTVSFLHWRVPSVAIAHLFPEGTRPDEFDGSSWVGLIAFELSEFAIRPGPVLPVVGRFPEINVRLYSVDARGRRGVVFRSLEATRLLTVLAARATLGVPYEWARMSLARTATTVTYRSRRLAHGHPSSHIVVRPLEEVVSRDDLADFLTARWGMHSVVLGRTRFVPNEHEPWPLRRAELTALDDELLAAAGVPGVSTRAPDSVLYSDGVRTRFGLPVRDT